jgi:zinc protease
MFNGSENHNEEYFTPLQEVGASTINGTTNSDRTNYFQTVPTTALDLALWLESDRMGHLLGAIDQDKLDEQRGVVQNEKRQRENQPYGKVFDYIASNVFPQGHPYSWPVIGSMEDLDAATLEDVHEWFQTYYGPNNATLVLAGDIDLATAKEKVQRYFGDIPPGPPLSRLETWLPDLPNDRRLLLEDRVPQARIQVHLPGPPAHQPRRFDQLLWHGSQSRPKDLSLIGGGIQGEGNQARSARAKVEAECLPAKHQMHHKQKQ